MARGKKGNRSVTFRVNDEDHPEISKALNEKKSNNERSEFIRKSLLLGIRRPDLLEQLDKIKPPQVTLNEVLKTSNF